MSEVKYPELFPIALGNEEETMILVENSAGILSEPDELVATYADFFPSNLKHVNERDSTRTFIQNGGLVYDGGTLVDNDKHYGANLERVTPECATPEQVAQHIQANELLMVKMLKNYVTRLHREDRPETVRLQRRVVDSQGNTRGTHDNFEVRNPEWSANFIENSLTGGALAFYLATRSFITGAGYVSNGNHYFAQKNESVSRIDGYGYLSSAYRNASDTDTGPRFEIRSNDINISPWAIRARIGNAALFLTFLQTPVAKALDNFMPLDRSAARRLENFRRYNRVAVDEDGVPVFSRSAVEALDFQERVMELMGDELGKFVDIGPEYADIINETKGYCEDFRKVIHGDIDLDVLADRSDVAAKFSLIARSIRHSRDEGIARTTGDIGCEVADLRYDLIRVIPGLTPGRPMIEYGYGYKKRDQGAFKGTYTDREIQKALYYPPKETRANFRGSLIRQEQVRDCEWSALRLRYVDEDQTIKMKTVMHDEAKTSELLADVKLSF